MRDLFYLENDENDVVLLELALRKVGCKDVVQWFRRSSDFKNALLNLSPTEFPRIILVDLLLDGEYGLRTIEWLSSQPLFRHIPAFVFSSGRILPEISAALEQNAAGYLFKPPTFSGFLELAAQLKEMIHSPASGLKADSFGAEEPVRQI
jgi:CheY-like chemotaxis protein